jgi:hypothetical protein
LIGGEGWEWLNEEQFAHGITQLELDCSPYQISMLYSRLSGGGDLLEFEDCVEKLFRPVFEMQQHRELLNKRIQQILRGDRLQTVRRLFSLAMNIEYFVFLVKEIVNSE